MTEDRSQRDKPRPGEREERSSKRAAMVVVVVAAVVVGAVLFINRDRLLVHSDVLPLTATTSTPTESSNQPPVINALTVETDRIEPFSLCALHCDAVDADGDPLTFTWAVSAGDIFGEGPSIEWGSPISEGLYRVSVTVDDGRGGAAEYSTPLRVQANVPPVFSGMSAETDWVPSGGSTRIECQVSDADGDTITLEWVATGGAILGTGNAIIWTAPEADGVYWIAVYARDTYGGEARRTLPMSVSSGEPPKIDGLFLQGVNTDMLRKVGNDWMIYQGRTAAITCAVLDQTAVYTYEWSADFGQITSDGPVATWVSPPSRVGATITVIVTDDKGNRSSASVLISVETCTCSF